MSAPTVVPGGDLSWMDDALCTQTDPETFFPEKHGSAREAKLVCAACAVPGGCLAYALAHNVRAGVWGGLSERQRARILNGTSA